MKIKAVSGIMLTLLLVSMLTLAFNIQTVTAIKKLVHNVDTGEHFKTIQEAIDDLDTLDGHTILVDAGIYYEHLTIDKSISLIGQNKYNTIIDGNYAGIVITVTADNVKITGVTVQKSGEHVVVGKDGIHVRSSGNNISYNILKDNFDGIYIYSSFNNTVFGNNIVANAAGIHLQWNSSNNFLSQNNITNNGHGIFLEYECRYNNISGNNISNCDGDGIVLYSSNYNNIFENIARANDHHGISMYSSQYNIIYHNNFVNNSEQVYSDSSPNTWDNGYPSGGNYWSDYTDVDLYSGPYQNKKGSDGIWDHPYAIDANDQDIYPLVEPWTPIPSDVNGDGKVDASDLVDLSEAYGFKLVDDNWNYRCDFNLDGKVDALDLFDLSKNYGKTK